LIAEQECLQNQYLCPGIKRQGPKRPVSHILSLGAKAEIKQPQQSYFNALETPDVHRVYFNIPLRLATLR
jgi:hypothetical protein